MHSTWVVSWKIITLARGRHPPRQWMVWAHSELSLVLLVMRTIIPVPSFPSLYLLHSAEPLGYEPPSLPNFSKTEPGNLYTLGTAVLLELGSGPPSWQSASILCCLLISQLNPHDGVDSCRIYCAGVCEHVKALAGGVESTRLLRWLAALTLNGPGEQW